MAPLRVLTEQNGGVDSVPELIAGRKVIEKKPLTATLACEGLTVTTTVVDCFA